MMGNDIFEDARLKGMIRQSKVEMPFSDFESRLMGRIVAEKSWRKSFVKNMRLSWLFFTIGSLFGIMATVLFPYFERRFFGFDLKLIQMPVLLVISFIILWQLDAMIKLNARNRTKHSNNS